MDSDSDSDNSTNALDCMDLDHDDNDTEDPVHNYNVLVGFIRTLQGCKGPIDDHMFQKMTSWLGIYIRVMEFTMNDIATFSRDPPTFQAAIREAHARALEIRAQGGVAPKTASAFCSLCQSILTVSQTTESLMEQDDDELDSRLSDIFGGFKLSTSGSLASS